MAKELKKQGWGKMKDLLDKEMPSNGSASKLVSNMIILGIFLSTLLGAFFSATYFQQKGNIQAELANCKKEFAHLQSQFEALQESMAFQEQNLKALHDKQLLHEQNSIHSTIYMGQEQKEEYLTVFETAQNREDLSLLALDSDDSEITFLPCSIKEPPIGSLETMKTQPIIKNEIPIHFSTNSKSGSTIKPVVTGDIGITKTVGNDKNGIEANVGIKFYPSRRVSILLSAGIMNQQTPLINQSAAAKASLARGFSPISIANEVEEESVSYSNYVFANFQLGTSYNISSKLRLLTMVKGSYILDKINFSQASIETFERTILIEESLSDLANNNQLHRLGFSGVFGIEYSLNDRFGLQVTYNKYITPLISQFPISFQSNPVHLRDFSKLAVSYFF